MLKLPALDEDELACIREGVPDRELFVRALAERLRQHLLATLGVAVEVTQSATLAAPAQPAGSEPAVLVDATLAAAWFDLRFGGRPGAMVSAVRDPALLRPMRRLIRRALAETAVNAGSQAVIPQAMRIGLQLGPLGGFIDIAWASQDAQAWAWRVMREAA